MKKILLLAALILSGCATTIPDTTQLKPDEGILVAGLECEAFMRLDIFESGKGPKPKALGHFFTDLEAMSTRAAFIPCLEDKLKTQALKEGDYYIGAVAAYGGIRTYAEEDSYKFSIHKQKLNYIGDLKGKRTRTRTSGNIRTSVVAMDFQDNHENNLKAMQNQFPNLSSKYDYRIDIAKK